MIVATLATGLGFIQLSFKNISGVVVAMPALHAVARTFKIFQFCYGVAPVGICVIAPPFLQALAVVCLSQFIQLLRTRPFQDSFEIVPQPLYFFYVSSLCLLHNIYS